MMDEGAIVKLWMKYEGAGDDALIEFVRAIEAAERERVLPKEPSHGLLRSMALRYDHALGMPGYYDTRPVQFGPTHAQVLDSTLRTMRQLYEEVSGHGFYRPELEGDYVARVRSNV